MGGMGSTRWYWHTKRQTVDDSLILNCDHTRKRVIDRRIFEGAINWRGDMRWSRGGYTLLIGQYTLDFLDYGKDGRAVMRLNYQRGGVKVSQVIELVAIPGTAGGRRWYWLCPKCRRRVMNLYMPPGARRWYCRACHDLTYASCQESHQYDRAAGIGGLVRLLDLDQRITRLYERLDRCKPGSKNYWRTIEQIRKIEPGYNRARRAARQQYPNE